jgi:hypothetical protein
MPALGNKGKVFCSFVEYHWDSGDDWDCLSVKNVALNSSYMYVNIGLNVISPSVDLGPSGGNRLAFSSKRQRRYRPAPTRGKHMDRPGRKNR